jgi:hypothetical protein
MSERLEFSFDGQPAGYFDEAGYPSAPGIYRYMPYRGPGHHRLQTALGSGRAACTYELDGATIHFEVLRCPEPGRLELAGFEAG